jgi:hypothetical protein
LLQLHLPTVSIHNQRGIGMLRRLLGGVALMALTISSLALGQVPPPPSNLTVLPTPTGAFLQWQGVSVVASYRVYKAADSATTFNRIGMTQQTSFVDGMVHPGHVYRYYVTAANNIGESGPSNVVTFALVPPPTGSVSGTVVDDSTGLPIRGVRIAFVRGSPNSTASWIVHTDSLGQYATTLDTGRYLVNASKMGYRTEWYDNSPEPSGATPVVVTNGGSATASFGLSPDSPPPPRPRGVIAGIIINDSTGAPIHGVQVRFFRANGTSMTPSAFTDSTGMYHVELDTGRYIVYATRFGFVPEYFDNVRAPQDATPVLVLPNAVTTANFGLTPGQPSPTPLVNVSGMVTDSASSQPIPHAMIAVVRTIRGLNTIQHSNGIPGGFPEEIVNSNGHGRMYGVVWHGFTDMNGHYTGRVPAGGTYIVFASADGHLAKWFNNKPSPIDADRLVLNHDTSGIDFALALNPLVQNGIAGSVIDSTQAGIPSHVVLFGATSAGPRPLRHTMTDSLGHFAFQFLPSRLYYVKALPVFGYAPAWYKAGAFGVEHWQDADTVRAVGNVSGVDIGVLPVPEGGVAVVSGRVTVAGTNTASDGAIVYAIPGGSQSIAGFDVAEADGSFRIEGLAPGSYQIAVDKEGFLSANNVACVVNATNNFQVSGLSVQVTPSSPMDVRIGDELPSRYALAQNYPNPFNPATTIRYSLPTNGWTTLKVYNLLGQEVATLVNELRPAGTYEARWDAAGFPSGIYFYQIHSGTFVETKKLTLMK